MPFPPTETVTVTPRGKNDSQLSTQKGAKARMLSGGGGRDDVSIERRRWHPRPRPAGMNSMHGVSLADCTFSILRGCREALTATPPRRAGQSRALRARSGSARPPYAAQTAPGRCRWPSPSRTPARSRLRENVHKFQFKIRSSSRALFDRPSPTHAPCRHRHILGSPAHMGQTLRAQQSPMTQQVQQR